MRTIAFASFRIDRIRASAKYPRFEMMNSHIRLSFASFAFLAQAGGARSVRQVAVWAKENEGRLRDAGLGLPHGVPSRQCLDRVFRKMPPAILRALERRWSSDLRNLEAGSVLAVDGKALRHASADGVHTPYVVSAWACDRGFVVGERKTAEKSNEITAIPGLLDDIASDIRGRVVTIDAAGCQKNIARKVADACAADYVFGLKGNQKNLHGEFLELFDTCRKACPDRFRAFATTDSGRMTAGLRRTMRRRTSRRSGIFSSACCGRRERNWD